MHKGKELEEKCAKVDEGKCGFALVHALLTELDGMLKSMLVRETIATIPSQVRRADMAEGDEDDEYVIDDSAWADLEQQHQRAEGAQTRRSTVQARSLKSTLLPATSKPRRRSVATELGQSPSSSSSSSPTARAQTCTGMRGRPTAPARRHRPFCSASIAVQGRSL